MFRPYMAIVLLFTLGYREPDTQVGHPPPLSHKNFLPEQVNQVQQAVLADSGIQLRFANACARYRVGRNEARLPVEDQSRYRIAVRIKAYGYGSKRIIATVTAV